MHFAIRQRGSRPAFWSYVAPWLGVSIMCDKSPPPHSKRWTGSTGYKEE